ncbi:ubiquitin carboxyl-terminal hydrolase [Aphelenchoides avenae]|nr:ubiquitin carboxyl-terminal hydrolase [Aphelenchus avenae]
MDKMAAVSAAAKRIQNDAAYLAGCLAETSADQAKLDKAEALVLEAERKLAAETKKREDAEKKLRETEDHNRRLQAEVTTLRAERDELKLKVENITAILSPQTYATDGPAAKKQRLSVEEGAAEEEQKKNREEESFFVELIVCMDDDMYSHSGFDLLDLKQLRREKAKMRVRETLTFADLYSIVAKNFKIEGRDFRMWQFHDINAERESNIMRHRNYLKSLRPHFVLKADAEHNDPDQAQTVEVLENENLMYIELGQPDSTAGYRLMPYNVDSDLLYFIKFYNHERKLTEYKGTLVVSLDTTWSAYLPEIRRRLELPPDAHLNVYVEFAPNAVEPHRNINRVVRDSQDYIVDGGILVVEVADKVGALTIGCPMLYNLPHNNAPYTMSTSDCGRNAATPQSYVDTRPHHIRHRNTTALRCGHCGRKPTWTPIAAAIPGGLCGTAMPVRIDHRKVPPQQTIPVNY